MSNIQPPNSKNSYQAKHVDLLLKSYKHWTGKELVNSDDTIEEQARKIFYAPFAVVYYSLSNFLIFIRFFTLLRMTNRKNTFV